MGLQEYMLEFYYDKPFPEQSPTAVTLQYMHQRIIGLSGPDAGFGAVPVSPSSSNHPQSRRSFHARYLSSTLDCPWRDMTRLVLEVAPCR